jgi:hypothetical protein
MHVISDRTHRSGDEGPREGVLFFIITDMFTSAPLASFIFENYRKLKLTRQKSVVLLVNLGDTRNSKRGLKV